MTTSPTIRDGVTRELLELVDSEYSRQYEDFYFMCCGRQGLRFAPLFGLPVGEEQKIKCRVMVDGKMTKKQWTLILSFDDTKWAEVVNATREKEVVFECVFKNPKGDPVSTPLFKLPSLFDADATYPITTLDFIGFAIPMTFCRGCVSVVSISGGVKMLVRLEETWSIYL